MTSLRTSWRRPATEGVAGVWLRSGVLLIGLLAPAAMRGQVPDGDPLVTDRSRMLAREVSVGRSFLPSHERYVVVHLAENRLFVMEGERATPAEQVSVIHFPEVDNSSGLKDVA